MDDDDEELSESAMDDEKYRGWRIIQLDCRDDCKTLILQLCRCAGIGSGTLIGKDLYIFRRSLDFFWNKAHDPELCLSAPDMTIDRKEFFFIANRLFGPVTVGIEEDYTGKFCDSEQQCEYVLDPLTMQETWAVCTSYPETP